MLALVMIVLSKQQTGSYLLASMLSAGFGAYSVVTVYREGLLTVWTNHTQNLWGIQVWWDLLFAVAIAFVFIVPRARQVGMSIPVWALLVASTASIALLAMIARLFWLEHQLDAPE
ncbi:hypothetical protein HUO12_04700 [Altererythrobacter sp. JGD-16]|uniref:DUF2834 domain-containing protein n=2 Tax=Altererythrobacter lutimaris TaxID=2743979 RepID=A0A850HAD4_9SPHN|nr:hypothetical protein [Altererythrobacter lutimaris]